MPPFPEQIFSPSFPLAAAKSKKEEEDDDDEGSMAQKEQMKKNKAEADAMRAKISGGKKK